MSWFVIIVIIEYWLVIILYKFIYHYFIIRINTMGCRCQIVIRLTWNLSWSKARCINLYEPLPSGWALLSLGFSKTTVSLIFYYNISFRGHLLRILVTFTFSPVLYNQVELSIWSSQLAHGPMAPLLFLYPWAWLSPVCKIMAELRPGTRVRHL